MNEREFRNEIHTYIDERYDQLLHYKDMLREVLKVFDKICRDNGLRYFLHFGTLLGAVRDKGFIPWDSDIDVCMPIKDVIKLHQIIKNQLPEKYFFDSDFCSKQFLYCESRIGIKGYPKAYVHLDIFYAIGAPEENQEQFRLKLAKLYNQKVLKKRAKYSEYSPLYSPLRFKLNTIKWSFESFFYNERRIDRELNKMMCMYDYDCASKIIVLCEFCRMYDKNMIEPIKETILEGMSTFLPNNEEAVLHQNYKKYEEYLPIEHRFDEFYSFVETCDILDGKKKKIDYFR